MAFQGVRKTVQCVAVAVVAGCLHPLAVLPAKAAMRDVDAAIVLAVDISQSIDPQTALLQRDGHARALTSPAVLEAIRNGPHGCIAVSYIEWASSGHIRILLEWTLICGQAQALQVANVIEEQGFAGVSRRAHRRTSISYAIDAGRLLLDQFPARANRKIVDISSNGTNNDGVPVADARMRAFRKGYIVNGIVLAESAVGSTDDLRGYFREQVICGRGAFVIAPSQPSDYPDALLRKLVQEIAGISAGSHLN